MSDVIIGSVQDTAATTSFDLFVFSSLLLANVALSLRDKLRPLYSFFPSDNHAGRKGSTSIRSFSVSRLSCSCVKLLIDRVFDVELFDATMADSYVADGKVIANCRTFQDMCFFKL